MKVLSLFDGLSSGQLALQRANIPYDKYYASEIDKYCLQVTQGNYPDTIQLGNVEGWSKWNIPWEEVDLILAGSPCQGFSFAGKQLAFDHPKSKLFFVFVDILKWVQMHNPNVKFLLENVVMKKEFREIITEHVGHMPVLLNSSMVSAQNRRRYYWSNFPVPLLEDKGIFLESIIEQNVAEKYLLPFSAESIHLAISNGLKNVAFTERRTEEAKEIRRRYRKEYGKDYSPRRAKELVPRSDKKMNCLTATYSLKEHVILDNNQNFRKLTPIEWERLQTMPDNYTLGVSDSQRYKMLGNAWTIDVISHILKGM